jgi:hypothetical protein
MTSATKSASTPLITLKILRGPGRREGAKSSGHLNGSTSGAEECVNSGRGSVPVPPHFARRPACQGLYFN